MGIKVLTLGLSSLILVLVLELIRREKLTFKYAFAWLGVGTLAVVLVVFDQVLFKLAHYLGFELTSNFVFFTVLATFVFLGLLLTIFLCQQNSRNDVMAQRIALLEFEIEQLKKYNEKESAS